jgi:acetyl esterase/lipase
MAPSDPSKSTFPHTSFWKNIYLYVAAYLLRWHITRRMTAFRKSYPQFWAPFAPTLTKSYPVLPSFIHRFFFPPEHKPGDTHPLFVLIHGGGWVFGSADMDDEQSALIAQAGYLVVSVEYPLGPRHRYPVAITHLEQVIHCVLADRELPLAPRQGARLVVGGFSAGGVMALALAQLPSLRDRVDAVVSFFPLADFTGSFRVKGEEDFRTTAWGEEDALKRTLGLFEWAYVPAGQDLRDPLLSPMYAARERLRARVCIITAEMDCLAEEGREMARRLAGRGDGGDWRENWEEGGVRYICAPGMPHSFTHFWVRPGGEWAERKKVVVRETWEGILGWLDGVVRTGQTVKGRV